MKKISSLKPNNQLGLSMVEMVISIAILGLFVLIWATIYFNTKASYEKLAKDLEQNKDEYLMNYSLQVNLSQGLDVRAGTLADFATGTCCSSYGIVAEYDSDTQYKDDVETLQPLMMFSRDARVNAGVATSGREPTVVAFQTPTETKSGVLYLFTREVDSGITVDPDLAQLKLENIVNLRVTGLSKIDAPSLVDGDLGLHPPVSQLIINYTVRKMIGAFGSGKIYYCPKGKMSSLCNTMGSYKDTEHQMVVVFRNNTVGESKSDMFREYVTNGSIMREVGVVPKFRLFGGIHFFQLGSAKKQ